MWVERALLWMIGATVLLGILFAVEITHPKHFQGGIDEVSAMYCRQAVAHPEYVYVNGRMWMIFEESDAMAMKLKGILEIQEFWKRRKES